MLPHMLIELGEVRVGATGTHLGEVRQVCHELQPLDLFLRRSTTPIAPAKQIQQVVVDVLLTIVHPGPGHTIRLQGTVVGIESSLRIDIWCRDEVSQDLGAIDTAPTKGISGHTVKLVPANLGGHEDGKPAPAHNLWERGAIAKDIGQPDLTRLDPKFLLPEAHPLQDLADERLAR